MKKIILFFLAFSFAIVANAQYKKDGTPDMRYKVNKDLYGSSNPSSSFNSNSTYNRSSIYDKPAQNTYSSPSISSEQRSYSNGGGIKIQNGYMRSNGTYVQPHFKTAPDNKTWNNLGSW
jgi:hypothetical protein